MDKILVVDDEAEVCNALKDFLTIKGYEVICAYDGEGAIKIVKKVRPELVLLDIIMPGMNGTDVLKEIKRFDPSIGVVMITAVLDSDLGNKLMEWGAYDYITKPVDLGYLETVIMVKLVDSVDG